MPYVVKSLSETDKNKRKLLQHGMISISYLCTYHNSIKKKRRLLEKLKTTFVTNDETSLMIDN